MPLITGTIQDESEALYVGTVIFENLDAPCSGGVRVNGPALTAIVTGSDGALPSGFRLAPGRTRLVVDGRKSKTFTVPTGDGTYDLSTLMATSTLHTRTVIWADDLNALREYRSSSTNFVAIVIADDNGAFCAFKWDATATNADDSAQYVRPNDFSTAGLWIRIL